MHLGAERQFNSDLITLHVLPVTKSKIVVFHEKGRKEKEGPIKMR